MPKMTRAEILANLNAMDDSILRLDHAVAVEPESESGRRKRKAIMDHAWAFENVRAVLLDQDPPNRRYYQTEVNR